MGRAGRKRQIDEASGKTIPLQDSNGRRRQDGRAIRVMKNTPFQTPRAANLLPIFRPDLAHQWPKGPKGENVVPRIVPPSGKRYVNCVLCTLHAIPSMSE
jgi:hypothetical protein